jgi:hypothetical protein
VLVLLFRGKTHTHSKGALESKKTKNAEFKFILLQHKTFYPNFWSWSSYKFEPDYYVYLGIRENATLCVLCKNFFLVNKYPRCAQSIHIQNFALGLKLAKGN